MNGTIARPWTVVAGCAVSAAMFVWDTLSWAFGEELAQSKALVALLMTFGLVPLAFTIAAFVRRNWGRIALAVLTVLGVLSLPLLLLWGTEAETMMDAETVLHSLAEVIVIVLLFLPASNEWYRRSPHQI